VTGVDNKSEILKIGNSIDDLDNKTDNSYISSVMGGTGSFSKPLGDIKKSTMNIQDYKNTTESCKTPRALSTILKASEIEGLPPR